MDLQTALIILGVPSDADDETLKQARRKLAAEYHPDRGGTTAQMQRVNEAYDFLSAFAQQERHVEAKPEPTYTQSSHPVADDEILSEMEKRFNQQFNHATPTGRSPQIKRKASAPFKFIMRLFALIVLWAVWFIVTGILLRLQPHIGKQVSDLSAVLLLGIWALMAYFSIRYAFSRRYSVLKLVGTMAISFLFI